MNRKQLRIVLLIAVIVGIYLFDYLQISRQTDSEIFAVIEQQQSDVIVTGSGEVVKVLPDDNEGSRHQRFLVKLGNQHVILIAHNIDLAPKIKNLREGKTITFRGEFEWNDKGGVVHWTHHDPAGKHPGGWLEYEGQRFE